MARLYECGFELNSTVSNHEYTKISTPTISTNPRTGTYAMNVTNPAAGVAKAGTFQFAAANANTVYAQIAIYFTVLPTSDCTIGGLIETGGTQPLNLWFQASDSKIYIKYNDFASQMATGKAVVTGQYYVFEVFFDRSPAAGSQVITARESGTQFVTASNLTLTNGVSEIRWGSNLQGDGVATMNIDWDDIVVNDNTGGSENSWVAQQKVESLRPNAAGDVNGFATQTGGTAGASNNYTRVNELPPDDATSFNGSSTLNEEDLFNMGATGAGASDTIKCVSVHARFRNSTADATAVLKLEIEKAAAGTILQGSAITPNTTTFNSDKTAAPRTSTLITYTDPDSGAWTQTTLNSMQAGYKLTTAPGTAGRRIDVTALWANVSYIVAAAATLTISVSDSITVSENIKPSYSLPSPIVDSVTVSEGIQISYSLPSPKFESVTVSESIQISYSLPSPIVDSVTVSENVSIQIITSVNLSDSVTVSENINLYILKLFISPFDSVTVSENISLSIPLPVSVFDSISVSENIQLLVLDNISLSDSVTVSENIQINYSLPSPITDSVTVSENISLSIVTGISVSDSISVSDVISLTISFNISPFESVTIVENIGLSVPLPVIVFDSVTLSENISLAVLVALFVFDSVTVSENTKLNYSLPSPIFELVSVSESVNLFIANLGVNVFDGVAVSESIGVTTVFNIGVLDNVVVTDAISIEAIRRVRMLITVSRGTIFNSQGLSAGGKTTQPY